MSAPDRSRRTEFSHRMPGVIRTVHRERGSWVRGSFYRTDGHGTLEFSGDTGWSGAHVRELQAHGEPVVLLTNTDSVHPSRVFANGLHVPAPTTPEAMAGFLAEQRVLGERLGQRRAEALIARHGVEAFTTMLVLTPRDQVNPSQFAGLEADAVLALRQTLLRDYRASPTLYATVHGVGLSLPIVRRVVESLGPLRALDVVEDPYLATAASGVEFADIDRAMAAVGWSQVAMDDPRRLRAAVAAALVRLQRSGHAYSAEEDVARTARRLLENVTISDDAMRLAFAHAATSGLVIREEDRWYHPSAYAAEAEIAAALRARAGREPPWRAHLQTVLDAPGSLSTLMDEQRAAVETALTHTTTLIAGGPGTGKTHCIATMVATARAANVPVTLTAASGNAARRLSEAAAQRATTIHHWLTKGELPEGLVVVDEAGMLTDDVVAETLRLAAEHGARTALCFVGDADQIRPVGRGQPFLDLLAAAESAPETVLAHRRLCTPHRAALTSLVGINGRRINQGLAPIQGSVYGLLWNDDLRRDLRMDAALADTPLDEGSFVANSHFVSIASRPVGKPLPPSLLVSGAPELSSEALRVYEVAEGLTTRYGTHDVRVMTAVHEGPLGTKSLNTALQWLHNRDGEPTGETDQRGLALRVGDPVVQKEPDKERDLVNGDAGIIVGVRDVKGRERVLLVDFTGREVDVSSRQARDLVMGYADTMHAQQGQEMPVAVIVVDPKAAEYMIGRSLLYTAATRAKAETIYVAAPGDIDRIVASADRDHRRTTLAERVMGRAPTQSAAAVTGDTVPAFRLDDPSPVTHGRR